MRSLEKILLHGKVLFTNEDDFEINIYLSIDYEYTTEGL